MMERVYGLDMLLYGEDGLTLWFLQQHLIKLLDQFQDDTPPEYCVRFYRPSFGRGGRYSKAPFGEFDFAILSRHRVYLGESKWDAFGSQTPETLEPQQIRRHRMMHAYIRRVLPDRRGCQRLAATCRTSVPTI